MYVNFKHNNRRYYGSSVSWVRVPVTALKVGKLSSLLSYGSRSSIDTSSSRKYKKVFVRSFRHHKWCKSFMASLTKRFHRRFKKPIIFRISNRGKKIEYYVKPNSRKVH